jgi:beta-propeller repeat-containing protein
MDLRTYTYSLVALLLVGEPSLVQANEMVATPGLQTLSEGEQDQIASAYSHLPLYFIANQGQVNAEQVFYYLAGVDKTLYFTSEGITFALDGEGKDAASNWTVKLDFVGANPAVVPQSLEPKSAVFSHFKGKPENWTTAIPTFGKIVYTDLWPGIDLVFSGTANTLKYQYVVHPGADPGNIQMTYRGLSDLSVNDNGELEVSTPVASFKDGVPAAWQVLEGEKVPVPMHYAIHKESEVDCFSYAFQVGDYHHNEALILDPAILVYCGYIGGIQGDYADSIAVDKLGCAYVTGSTSSNQNSFPVSVGPDLTFNGGGDVFIAKVNAKGTNLLYCGFIGGDKLESAWGIAVDDQGSAYVTGATRSDESTFPVLVGPDLTFNSGWGIMNDDAFVAKINPQGTGLDYCGYIGGDRIDFANGIAVDKTGSAFVVGATNSTESTFPLAVGPDLSFNGRFDCFVAKVNPLGDGLDYCGYIGGSMGDHGMGIAVDSQGNAYVAGGTDSDQTSFPVISGPDLTFNDTNNAKDGFVAKVNRLGTGLEYCGYIGGAVQDSCSSIAVDAQGSAYVTGNTWSDENSFPVIVGPDLTFNDITNTSDCFVAKVNPLGTDLDYCGYIGGEFVDDGFFIAVDHIGNAYVTGTTYSDHSSFPVIDGPDLFYNGADDAFVAKVNHQGTGLDYCGYIGGYYSDFGIGIAVDAQGSAYVVGATNSDETTFPVLVGPDLNFNGSLASGDDGFVAKIQTTLFDLSMNPDPLIAGQAATFSVTDGTPTTATYLAYSLKGLGSTPVPSLNLTLGLADPILGAGPTNSNAQGRVDWLMFIPMKAAGVSIWGQAMQHGIVTNVKLTLVQ